VIDVNRPILLVEDSPEDAEVTFRAFERAGLANPIFHCETGDDGLDFLYGRGKYADPSQSPRPSMILLDLNLPGTDGREVLAEIKQDDRLKTIPVLVLTTSADERDIGNCYQMGANSYIKKRVALDEFFRSVQQLKDFWFEAAVLPDQAI